jgi:hypothetical protein
LLHGNTAYIKEQPFSRFGKSANWLSPEPLKALIASGLYLPQNVFLIAQGV